jgi:Domain of unknown function (DUF4384)
MPHPTLGLASPVFTPLRRHSHGARMRQHHLPLLELFAAASFWLSTVTAPMAQGTVTAPNANQVPGRSVTILPNGPDAPAPNAVPSVSPAELDALNSNIKAENPAGVSIELIPSGEVVAGSKVGFRITTKKQGYLILLDVAATGKLTQIFPSLQATTRGARDAANLVRPGRPLTIPQLGTPHATFEFVAEAPAGIAMAVALLSDKPVQVVDLPNAPPPAFAPNDTLKYVIDKARQLMLPSGNGLEMERPKWSFDGKFYLIK